jgi:molybdopterin-guanine dinucleotide biosynthesis protein B
MKDPVIFGIYGKSNTGKTNLITELITKFSNENYKVASVKVTDKKISIDTENKDTYKHSNAGSELVVFSTKKETDFLINQELSIKEIINYISIFKKFDLILIEGINDKKTKKIRIGDISKRENTIIDYRDNFNDIYNIIKNEI